MTTGKTIALTRQAFAGKVMSLLFNMLSRLVISFSSKEQVSLIMVAVTICSDFGAPHAKKYLTASTFPPSIYQEVMGPEWEKLEISSRKSEIQRQ